jgi:hypothetical protein
MNKEDIQRTISANLAQIAKLARETDELSKLLSGKKRVQYADEQVGGTENDANQSKRLKPTTDEMDAYKRKYLKNKGKMGAGRPPSWWSSSEEKKAADRELG